MTSLSQSSQYYQRITTNKVAQLIQSQTRFIYDNFFTVKTPVIESFKSFYCEAALQEMFGDGKAEAHDSRLERAVLLIQL